MNLWKDLLPGPDVPHMIHVVVEIPKGSRNKYEFDKSTGMLRLDRVLYSPLHYPGDYGLIPRTLYEDGDPLDVLVMVTEPTFPECIIVARPIGLFRMMDREVPDDKILAVPAMDPLFQDYHDISDIPQHFLREVAHFFAVYKDLEGGAGADAGMGERGSGQGADPSRRPALRGARRGVKDPNRWRPRRDDRRRICFRGPELSPLRREGRDVGGF